MPIKGKSNVVADAISRQKQINMKIDQYGNLLRNSTGINAISKCHLGSEFSEVLKSECELWHSPENDSE